MPLGIELGRSESLRFEFTQEPIGSIARRTVNCAVLNRQKQGHSAIVWQMLGKSRLKSLMQVKHWSKARTTR
jgi:hypothetical protein